VKVGEIFIQLGFEVQGRDQASGFQSIVDSIAKSTAILTETIEELRQEFIEQMEGTKKTAAATKKAGDETEKNTKKTKENKVAVSQQVGELWKARLGFVGLAAAIVYTTQKASAYAQALNVFSNTTGLSSQQLQKWEQHAASAGITAEEMASTVRNLQKAGTDVLMGQGNAKPWAFLGLAPSQDPFDVLEKLKASLKSVPTALGSRMAEELGLSDAMISFLREAEQLPQGEEGLLLKDSDLKRLKQFNIYFNQTLDTVKRQTRQFGVVMAPIADYMLYAFGKVADSVLYLTTQLGKFNDLSGGEFFQVLTLGALGLAAALFPSTFAAAAFLLVFQDIVGFFKGENSVFGFWLNQLSSLKDILESIPALIATIVDKLTGGAFTEQITAVLQSVTGGLKELAGVEGAGFGNLDKNVFAMKQAIMPNIPGDYLTLAQSGVTSSMKEKPVVNNNINITVDGSKDPKRTGFEIEAILSKQNNFSLRQMPIGEAP